MNVIEHIDMLSSEQASNKGLSVTVALRQAHFHENSFLFKECAVLAPPSPGAVAGRPAVGRAGNLSPRLRVFGSAPARPCRFNIRDLHHTS